MDTHCKSTDNNKIYYKDNIKNEDFILKKDHSLKYEEHNYIRKHVIKNDIYNLSKKEL